MDTIERNAIPTVIGTPFGGGFWLANYMDAGKERALIRAPKAVGHFKAQWNNSLKDVPGACSFFDGMANTVAMAKAGSKIAKELLALTIGGVGGWCLPAQDQLELCYRALKPGTSKNWLYNRSGINVSALPPTYPYEPDFPAQTPLPLFQAGGAEAFELGYYWSSTQHRAGPGWAWLQDFGGGSQDGHDKCYSQWAFAVRSIEIIR